MDETPEDSLMKHVTSGIYDVACTEHIQYMVRTDTAGTAGWSTTRRSEGQIHAGSCDLWTQRIDWIRPDIIVPRLHYEFVMHQGAAGNTQHL
jgi:hypothetical protein